MEGTVLGGGGDEVSSIPAVYPCGMIIVSSLGSFLYVGSSYKPYHPSLNLYIRVHHIQEYFKKKRGRKKKYIKPQEDNVRRDQQMKKMRVTI